VEGSSFLLHHIRHMIGAAVAVACGAMSLELLQASLSLPARVATPRAPPHSLLLLDCTFFDFPVAGSNEPMASEWVTQALLMGPGLLALRGPLPRWRRCRAQASAGAAPLGMCRAVLCCAVPCCA
jgi:hypothetical protein